MRPSFLHRLCFTAEDHLDLSWLLVVIFTVLAIAGSAVELYAAVQSARPGSAPFTIAGRAVPPINFGRPSPWWWLWLAGSQISVLIAAVPIAKARILANSRVLAANARAQGEASRQSTPFVPNQWASGVEEGVL